MDVPGIALITGGASGIGSACAKEFAIKGAAGIAVVDLDLDAAHKVKLEVEGVAKAPNFKAAAWKLDVSDEAEVERVLDEVKRAFGRIDYLVNSAGIVVIHEGGSAAAETRDWEKVMRVNLDGTFLVSRAAARIMLAQEPLGDARNGLKVTKGSIVNVSSIAGIVGVGQSTAYASSKHAVVGLSRTMSEDHAQDGIRVNVVCPGYVLPKQTSRARLEMNVKADATIADTSKRP